MTVTATPSPRPGWHAGRAPLDREVRRRGAAARARLRTGKVWYAASLAEFEVAIRRFTEPVVTGAAAVPIDLEATRRAVDAYRLEWAARTAGGVADLPDADDDAVVPLVPRRASKWASGRAKKPRTGRTRAEYPAEDLP